jgi:hypothetical protein
LSCTIDPLAYSYPTQDTFIKSRGLEILHCILQTIEPSLIFRGSFPRLTQCCTCPNHITRGPQKTGHDRVYIAFGMENFFWFSLFFCEIEVFSIKILRGSMELLRSKESLD